MAEARGRQSILANLLRWIARTILLAWAMIWLYYYAGLALAGYNSAGLYGAALPAALFAAIVLSLFVAWNLELLGALVFLAAAVLAFFQWEQPHWFSLLTICLPLALAGLLLLSAWLVARLMRRAAAAMPVIAPPGEQQTDDESRWQDPGW